MIHSTVEVRINKCSLELNRQILDGPSTDEDELDLRAKGYRPELILDPFSKEAEAENALARLLDQKLRWRRGRLRDVVSAREIFFHINSLLRSAATARGLNGFDDMLCNLEDPRRAFDAMPSFDVSVTLKTAIHKNSNHQWKNNHVHDINALVTTLPYCDIVLTDREMAAFVRRSKLDTQLGTIVLHSLQDLVALL